VLKDDGLLVFTFHHEAPRAWGAILDAALQAGFDIRRVWTYHSETTMWQIPLKNGCTAPTADNLSIAKLLTAKFLPEDSKGRK
jgi:hypothetical protein